MLLEKTKRRILTNWWLTGDGVFLSCLGLLIVLGIVLIMAASPTVAQKIGLSSFHFFSKQVAFILAGLFMIVTISFMDIVTIRRMAVIGFLFSLLLLFSVEIFGYETKGAKRWIYLIGFSLQPSEIIKPFFAILNAWLLTRRNLDEKFPGYLLSISVLSIIILLLIRQPDFGMSLTIFSIWFTQLIVGGLNIFIVISLIIVGGVCSLMAYFSLPHVKKRIDSFFDSGHIDYQTKKSLEAFENGGVFGVGPGQGDVKNILPDSHTDFIFSVAGEEFGLLFCLGIIILYGIVILRPIWKIYDNKDLFIILSICGLAVQLFFQAAVNMGVATNLIPNTGMTLPFISYGGSSMLSVSICAGIILAFTRKKYGV